jgi:hypothetical protein
MNMLVEYDAASRLLSSALNSRDLRVVSQSRLDLELLKVRAKQIRNRQLLADATEFQLRVERWLGQLLIDAKEAGQLRQAGNRGAAGGKSDLNKPPTLAEINIDKRLSAKAQHAAALDLPAFERVVSEARDRIASGKAHIVNPKMPRVGSGSSSNWCLAFPSPDIRRWTISQLRANAIALQRVLDHVGNSSEIEMVGNVISDEMLRSLFSK